MQARLINVVSQRIPLYTEWLVSCLAQIYEREFDSASLAERLKQTLTRESQSPASLLLVAEVVSPLAEATGTCSMGYTEAAMLLCLPLRDPLLETEDAWLRVLFTRPAYRNQGLSRALIETAESTLRSRGVGGLRVDVTYGDDAITGIFERRGYVRGRMTLHQALDH